MDNDNVQKRSPLFFLGCSPSQAKTLITSASGAMISINRGDCAV